MKLKRLIFGAAAAALSAYLLNRTAASVRGSTRGVCDPEEHAPVPPEEPPCPVINEKWDLWRGATCLRGANIWQKRVRPDEGMGPGPVGPPYLPTDLPQLAVWGANYLNISHPGVFDEMEQANGSYRFNEGVFANLERLIERAEQAGLFVVVAYRTGPGRTEGVFSGNPKLSKVWKSEGARRGWVEMWRETARRLKSRKNVVAYDLMVEPETKDHRLWNMLAGRIIKAIRDIDSEMPILVGAANWSTVAALPCAARSDDSRIVYTIHQYEPFGYTHQKQGSGEPYLGGLEDLYERIHGFKIKRGAAVAVNEFGVKRWAPGAGEFLKTQFDLLERIGANHALWLWETSHPLNYDDFNFKRATSELISTIKRNWERNRLRPEDVRAKF